MKRNSTYGVRRHRPLLVLAIFFLLNAEALLGRVGGHSEFEAEGWRQLPVPFSTEEKILDFLASARVVSSKRLDSGTNHPLRVDLEKDGVRLRAIFRDVDRKLPKVRINKAFRYNARDCAIFEIAAYELSRMLGLNLVPPTVWRQLDGRWGSLQLWIEGAMTLSERTRQRIAPERPTEWVRTLSTSWFFDSLVHNDDRNLGNLLVDAQGNLWLIDHTLSFYPSQELLQPDRLDHLEEGLWLRLREVSPETVRQRLRSSLTRKEIDSLLRRWNRLVKLFEGLIREKGEERVLFTLER